MTLTFDGAQNSKPPVRMKRSLACNFCRAKKVRCKVFSPTPSGRHCLNTRTGNGGSPCTNCLDHGEVCVASTKRRSRAKTKENEINAISQRLRHVEALLHTAHETANDSRKEKSLPADDFGHIGPADRLLATTAPRLLIAVEGASQSPNAPRMDSPVGDQSDTPAHQFSSILPPAERHPCRPTVSDPPSPVAPDDVEATPDEKREGSSVYSGETVIFPPASRLRLTTRKVQLGVSRSRP